MPDSAVILRFVLVLTRISAVLVFVPVPGVRALPQTVKAVFVLSMAVALFPCWPQLPVPSPSPGQFVAWMSGEALAGLALGLIVAFLSEVFALAMQIIGLQAGYSYASTIDPNSEADSAVLSILAQLGANLLFFTAGMDHAVIKAFARSLELWPPGGAGGSSAAVIDVILKQGSAMIELGVRLALPVIGFLLLLDLTLALLGRLQSQLQLLTLAFPLKMLAALALLVVLLPVFVRLYGRAVQSSAGTLVRVLGT